MSKERVEEEGECEDGVEVVASKDRNIAQYNEDTAKALSTNFKQECMLYSYSL